MNRTGRSAEVRMALAVNGYVLPIAQLGPNFLILREPAEHARIIMMILDGKGPPGARAATLLNAAAAIYVSGTVKSYADGVAAAKTSIDSGQAKSVLDRLRRASPNPAKTIA